MDYSTNFQNVSVVRETRRRNCATNGCQQMRVFCPTTVLRGSLSQVRSAWWFKVPSNNYLQKYDTNNLKGPFRTFSTRDGTATKCGAWFDWEFSTTKQLKKCVLLVLVPNEVYAFVWVPNMLIYNKPWEESHRFEVLLRMVRGQLFFTKHPQRVGCFLIIFVFCANH